ncbi:MAG: sulfotransferase [Puniceicoccaceae bacterium]
MDSIIQSNQYLLIIGAMKCGTSSLFRYLSSHPEICPAYHKEPEYFSSFPGIDKDSDYQDLWPDFDPSQHKYAMEASTGYTKYPACPDAAERIKDAGIQPKLIYLVRDPFDRIVSHFNFMTNPESRESGIVGDYYLDVSRYHMQLGQFRKLFPKEDLLVLDFAELKSDPNKLMDRVYAFLGLSSTAYPESFEVVNALQMESKAEYRIRKSKVRGVLRYIPMPIKNFAKRLLRKANPPSKRLLTSEEKSYIGEQLKADIASFSEEYNFDTSKWM